MGWTHWEDDIDDIDDIDARVPNVPSAAPAASPEEAPQQRKTSKLAILSIVLACLFFVPLLPAIGAILGIVTAVMLRGRPHLGGRGAAIAAIPTGFVVFFFVQAMLAAIAIPAFVKFERKSKSVEATVGLDRIRYAARGHAGADRYDDRGNLLPKRFPVARTAWVPSTPCCDQGRKCRPDAAQWSASPWKELHFEMADSHYYQWRYESDGRSFKAEARGDLDCDGIYSEYAIQGTLDAQGLVQVRGPIITNEIE